jgi:hypothetical protein
MSAASYKQWFGHFLNAQTEYRKRNIDLSR